MNRNEISSNHIRRIADRYAAFFLPAIAACCLLAAASEARGQAARGLACDVVMEKDSWPRLRTLFEFRGALSSPLRVEFAEIAAADVASPPAAPGADAGEEIPPAMACRFPKPRYDAFDVRPGQDAAGGFLRCWASQFTPFMLFETNGRYFMINPVLFDPAVGEMHARERNDAKYGRGPRPAAGKKLKERVDSMKQEAQARSGELLPLPQAFFPAAVAYMSESGPRTARIPAEFDGIEMKENWLLVWYDGLLPRPYPLLLILQYIPQSVEMSGEGLRLDFGGAAGHVVVIPFYGFRFPEQSETDAWLDALPRDAVERARLLSRVSRFFPLHAEESIEIDQGSGDITVEQEWMFKEIRDEWETPGIKLAAMPPYMAVALRGETQARFSGEMLDIDYVVASGRIAGARDADEISATLPGFARYWRQQRRVGEIPEAAGPYVKELEKEIRRMIEAGHLMPGYCSSGISDWHLAYVAGQFLLDYWHNPADSIYTLLRALPLVPAQIHGPLEEYVKKEFGDYPPDKVWHIGWKDGAWRDNFDPPPEVAEDFENWPPNSLKDCKFSGWSFPPYNIYALWQYADAFGGGEELYARSVPLVPPVKPEMTWAYGMTWECTGALTLNSTLAGLIGYARLAGLSGEAVEVSRAEARLARLMLLKAAMLKNPLSLADSGYSRYGHHGYTLDKFGPDEVRMLPVRAWYEFTIDFVNMTPEVARMLRDYAPDGVRAYVESFEDRHPYWFVSMAEEIAGEGKSCTFYDYVSLFQAKALALGEGPDKLERYLDIPAVEIGDLFYIQNLCALIEAYGEEAWE